MIRTLLIFHGLLFKLPLMLEQFPALCPITALKHPLGYSMKGEPTEDFSTAALYLWSISQSRQRQFQQVPQDLVWTGIGWIENGAI